MLSWKSVENDHDLIMIKSISSSYFSQLEESSLEIERLLLRTSNHAAPHRGLQMKNSKFRVCLNIRQVLRGDEDELSVFHFFGDLDQGVEGKLSSYRIEKNIELVHHTERCFKAFPNGEEQGKSGKAPLTTTQCLDIVGLGTFISVVL